MFPRPPGSAPLEPLARWSADLSSGRSTSSGLVQRCLATIAAGEPQVRAWVEVFAEAALAAAAERDAEAARGMRRGPLHGIPLGIKDIVDIADRPTRCGWFGPDAPPATSDAVVVQRLRDVGAIVLGKTVTTAFACYDPPPTGNPWHADRTPGGSSSGSAAAVAAGHVPASIGSQTGGSITRPAAFCGICGCKPSYGRVGRRGVMPLAPTLDHVGPLARTVQDLALVLDAIVGFDPLDEGSSSAAWEPLAPQLQDAGRLPAPRLGLLRGAFVERSAADQTRVLEAAVARWTKDGATASEIRFEPASSAAGKEVWWPEPFDATQRTHRTIMAVEAALAHAERSPAEIDAFPRAIRALIDEGRALEATTYAAARIARRRLRRRIDEAFRTADVLICPAARGGAPDRSSTGDPQFNTPWSLTGLPTVSVPVGFDDDGLPVSAQFVGPALGEARLFAAAAWCEARRDVADVSGAARR